MDVSFATAAAPGRRNEDLVIAGEDFLIVLDGVTSPPHVPTGCLHDPVWLVRTLGSALVGGLSGPDVPSLTDVLATAIRDVCAAHAATCDLSHPDSPSSTVVVLREHDGRLDHLVLCDSALVLLGAGGEIAEVVTDDRTAAMRGLTRAEVAARRNHEGGFWVASTDPAAARQALTGSRPAAATSAAFACTDGVSRLVDHFGWPWERVIAAATAGPVRDVLRAVRQEELAVPPSTGRKRHDDATAAFATFTAASCS